MIVKIDRRTRHRLIALSSVREIGKDRKLSRLQSSARIVDKLTGRQRENQACERSPDREPGMMKLHSDCQARCR